MKHLATLFATNLLLSAATASAQTTFRLGVRGGLNRAQMTQQVATNTFYSQTIDNSGLYAWQAGGALEVNFGHFALQPALVFSQKGLQFNTTSSIVGFAGTDTRQSTGTSRYNWLELPLNLVYTLHGDHGLQLFAGPYVALAVGGHQRGTSNSRSWTGDTRTSSLDQKFSYADVSNGQRMDAGVNFGVGYRQGPLQVQLAYGLGLRDLHELTQKVSPEAGVIDRAYNRGAQLTGTYFFAL
jgi:hypothetical protein